MNVSQFVLCQPWAVQLPEESWQKLLQSRGRTRVTSVMEHGAASFVVASVSVSFSTADGLPSELQELHAAVPMQIWIVETADSPAALIIRFSDAYYFVDHTMLRSLSIQRNTRKNSLSMSQQSTGSRVLCFCWPLELEMTLSVYNGDGVEKSTVVERLNAIVNAMSTMLTKRLSTDSILYPLWNANSDQDDDEEIVIKKCIQNSLKCSRLVTAMTHGPLTAKDLYKLNKLSAPAGFSGFDLGSEDIYSRYHSHVPGFVSSFACASLPATTAEVLEARVLKKRKRKMESVEIELSTIFDEHSSGAGLEV